MWGEDRYACSRDRMALLKGTAKLVLPAVRAAPSPAIGKLLECIKHLISLFYIGSEPLIVTYRSKMLCVYIKENHRGKIDRLKASIYEQYSIQS